MAGKLSDKQQTFVNEYLVDLNATQAAIRTGYSEKTAKQQGSRMLTNVDVAEAVQKEQEKRLKKLEIDADWVLKEAIDLYNECRREADRPQANNSLEKVGKHTKIQAWNEKKTLDYGADTLAAMLNIIDGTSKGPPSER